MRLVLGSSHTREQPGDVLPRLATTGSPALELSLAGILAIALTALPVGLHLIGQSVALAADIAGAIVVASMWPRAIPVVVFVAYCLQSSFVSMTSSQVPTIQDMEPMKIYSFVTTAVIWLVTAARYANNLSAYSPFTHRLMLCTSAALALVGCFFVIGLLFDARGASIYMRNIGLPILLFQTCLLVASKEVVMLRGVAGIVLGLLILCGYTEMLAVERWLDLTNGWVYWDKAFAYERESGIWIKRVQEGAQVVTGVLDLLKSDFLNTNFFASEGLTIVRLQGPNFHSISFGYALAIFGSVLAIHGRILMPVIMTPLLLMASAKGAIVLFIFSITFCFIARVRAHRFVWNGLLVVLCLFAVVAFISGLRTGDYHVLGLIGGVNGFLRNPFGHSLGQGGNLSTNFAEVDWNAYQASGSSELAIESAVGVLIFQMGIAAIALLGLYFWLSKTAWRLYQTFGFSALAWSSAAIAIILVNGLFQEEALFAPLAFALILAITGLAFGSLDRVVMSGQLRGE